MKRESTNSFTEGLVMDFNPITTPNNVLTNCLNGTILTLNGHEKTLQNDMGNGRVETAVLPEGYVPVGTCSYGGIIYIVSYNPELDLCQIGSFPSPERNITTDEITQPEASINNNDFIEVKEDNLPYVKKALVKLQLLDDDFNSGDKFKIYFGGDIQTDVSNLKDVLTDYGNIDHIFGSSPKRLRVNVVAVNEGKIEYLNDKLKWYSTDEVNNFEELPAQQKTEAYYIAQPNNSGTSDDTTNLDKYRSLVNTPYNIFTSKSKGKLNLFLELETIDTFSATSNISKNEDDTFSVNFEFGYTSGHKDIYPGFIFLKSENFDLTADEENNNNWSDYNRHKYIRYYKDQGFQGNWVKGFKSTDIWKYKLTPAMSFGLLDYLSIEDTIDFSKVGSNTAEIKSWRYYSNSGTESSLLLSFNTGVYPLENQKCKQIELKFWDLGELRYSFNESEDTPNATYIISNKESYSGNFSLTIPYGKSIKELKGQLNENTFYLVKMIVTLGTEPSDENGEWVSTTDIPFYKSIWTCPVFNKAYFDSSITDFTTLKLSDYLKAIAEVKVINDNFQLDVDTYQQTQKSDSTIYQQITTFSKNDVTICTSNNVSFENDYNTFKLPDNTYYTITYINTTSDPDYDDNGSSNIVYGNNIDGLKNTITDTFDIKASDNTYTATIKLHKIAWFKKSTDPVEVTVQNLLKPILSEELGEHYNMNTSAGNYTPNKLGILSYGDEGGKGDGILMTTASHTDNCISLSGDWEFGCPGTDSYSKYYLNSNTYNSSEDDPLSGHVNVTNPKIGINSAINNICDRYDYQFTFFVITGWWDDDSCRVRNYKLGSHTVQDYGKDDNDLSLGYITKDKPIYYNNIFNFLAFIKTESDDYKPVLLSKDESSYTLINYLQHLYYLSGETSTVNTYLIDSIVYQEPYSKIVTINSSFDLNINNIQFSNTDLDQVKDLLSTNSSILISTNNLFYDEENQTMNLTLQFSFYLDDSKQVNELIQQTQVEYVSGILYYEKEGGVKTEKILTLNQTLKEGQLYILYDNIGKNYMPSYIPKLSENNRHTKLNGNIVFSKKFIKNLKVDQYGKLYLDTSSLNTIKLNIQTDNSDKKCDIFDIPDVTLFETVSQ